MSITDEEFKEVKRILQRMLHVKADLNECGLYARPSLPWSPGKEFVDAEAGRDYQLVISDDELRARLDSLPEWEEDTPLESITKNRYERAIMMDRRELLFRRHAEDDDVRAIQTSDKKNGIVYTISERPSPDYCLLLVLKAAKEMALHGDGAGWRILWAPLARFKVGEGCDFDYLLQRSVRSAAIIVESEKDLSSTKLRDFANAYAFTVMYRTGCPCGEYQDVGQILGLRLRRMLGSAEVDLETPPARVYDKDVIDYYSMALMSGDPYIGFISFYHVLEYYFDSVFRAEVSNKLRDMITKPSFSYTKEAELFKVVRAITKEMRRTYEIGYGNERNELEYVLRKYIALDEVMARLEEIDPGSVDRYRDHRCEFSRKVTTIDWANREKAIGAIVKRVYETRNALIHSKNLEDENVHRYRPYNDERKLRGELPLIQALAEQVLIGSGRILRA